MAVLPAGALLVVSLIGDHLLLARYALSSVVGWNVLVAVVVAGAIRTLRAAAPTTLRRTATALATCLTAAGGLAVGEALHFGLLQPHRPDEDPRATAAWILARDQAGDAVLYDHEQSAEPVRWYLVNRGPADPPADLIRSVDVSAATAGLRVPPLGTENAVLEQFTHVDRLFIVRDSRSGALRSSGVGRAVADEVTRCWTLIDEGAPSYAVQLWTRPADGTPC